MTFLKSLILSQMSNYRVLSTWSTFLVAYHKKQHLPLISELHDEYKGKRVVPMPHPTRGMFKPQSEEQVRQFCNDIAKQLINYKSRFENKLSVNATYDSDNGCIHIDGNCIYLPDEPYFYVVFFYVLVPLSFIRNIRFIHLKDERDPLLLQNGIYRYFAWKDQSSNTRHSEEQFYIQIGKIFDEYEFLQNYFALNAN